MLIKCPECGKEISDVAEVCVHCGYPLKTKHKKLERSIPANMPCPECGSNWHTYENENIYCKVCKHIFTDLEITTYEKKQQAIQASKIKCPNCHSTNVKKISTTERATSVVTLGLLSKKINKSYKCLNCKYTW